MADILSINSCALKYWRERTYSVEQINEVCCAINDKFMAARFDFCPHKGIQAQITGRTRINMEGHVPALAKAFENLVSTWKGEPLRGSFLVLLEDGLWHSPAHSFRYCAPTFCYGRPRSELTFFLMPDPSFLHTRGYKEQLGRIHNINERLPWDMKTPVLFWRGATSDLASGIGGDWKRSPRSILTRKSLELNDPRLDAGFSNYVDVNGFCSREEVESLNLIKGAVPPFDFFTYRYLISLDGISSSWISTFLNLASDSTALRVASPQDHVQWYETLLTPWNDYIPLDRELTELEQILDWLEAHPTEARHIAECGAETMAELTYENELNRFGCLLSELFKYQTS